MNDLSIIIPCYNEEKNISSISAQLKQLNFSSKKIELIFVNNGSTDNTEREIIKLCQENKIARMVVVQKNLGYGHGISEGLKKSSGRFIGWTHADLQTDFADLLKALEIIHQNNFNTDIYIKGCRINRPMKDRFFSFSMAVLASIVSGKRMSEINAQPNIFHSSMLSEFNSSAPIDFSLDLHMYYHAKKANLKFLRFPVGFNERSYGESKWNKNFKSRIIFILKAMKAIYRYRCYE